ncbi:MAG TPA: ATP-dependent helicase [Tepidisphaeraceae bacterium]|jgi:superfamily I DNA/RNA helicase
MHLNPHQEQVASHIHGRILTLAGPGSGKTKTLTERTGRLIKKGFDPASILCLTFTNKARDEMRDRIAAVHGSAAEKVFISNFHGLAGILLRTHGAAIGYDRRMTIIDSDDQLDLLLQIARKRGLAPTRPEARTLCFLANEWRENLGTEDHLDALAAARKISRSECNIITAYVKLLRSRNQCDFSGMLSETARLLRTRDDIRTQLQHKFHFIQVDEYQDTNRAQNEIVELLAGKEDNILAVGDGDQSIYEWRGATPDAIPNFIKNGENKTGKCTVIKLGTNYRSTPQIIAVADKLIRHCKNRIIVDFSTTNPDGEPVKCVKFEDPEKEAEAVALSIDNTIKAHTQPRQIAVFFRTNDMSRLIEQALAKRQIPYQVVGAGSYYDRMEVKDVLSMLRFICNPKDGIAFHRIANKPARGMGDALIGKIESFAEQHHIDLLTAMQDRNLEFLFASTPSPGTPGEGRGEGSSWIDNNATIANTSPPSTGTPGEGGGEGFSWNDEGADTANTSPPSPGTPGEGGGEGRSPTGAQRQAALRAIRETRHIFDIDLSRTSLANLAPELLSRSRYDDWLKDRYEDKSDYEDRSRNVTELLNAIAEYARHNPRHTVEDYLASISLYTDKDESKTDDAVRLMSLHASKGLEFDVVYMIGLEHTILPHEKALADRGQKGLDEERRLCYVGFTRAKKILRVTWCAKRQETYSKSKTARFKPAIPSQFLTEAGLVSPEDYRTAMTEAGFVEIKTTNSPRKKRTPV